MRECVSEDIQTSQNALTDSDERCDYESSDILYELKLQYRFLRKKISAHIKNKKCIKTLKNILYITADYIPTEYIVSLQKQYPNYVINVLTFNQGNITKTEKHIKKFYYFLQNKKNKAYLFEYPAQKENIKIYGIFCENFLKDKNTNDIYNFQNLAHFAKCIRTAVKYLNFDIIHVENIPFYFGMEFESKQQSDYKIVQTIHHLSMFQNVEPFWSVINLADKKTIQKICKDNIIKRNISALFNIKVNRKFHTLDSCLGYLYKNFENYRKICSIEQNTNENIIFRRLNKRVTELFPKIYFDEQSMYNPLNKIALSSNYLIINSKDENYPDRIKNLSERYCSLIRCCSNSGQEYLLNSFDITNFRGKKLENKNYIYKEFSYERIKAKFMDTNLFKEKEVQIVGFLDSFYNGILLFIYINSNTCEIAIKDCYYALLKCFEQNKNIQVIINIPHKFKSPSLDALLDFFVKQDYLAGKWILLEGKINNAQILASSDIILLPDSNIVGIEDILYNSLKYGCIPVTTEQGICGEIVADIFDDMTKGCGFKHGDIQSKTTSEDKKFGAVLLKAINFYYHNPASWNKLIENSLKYDSSWNFHLIEKYNEIYENL